MFWCQPLTLSGVELSGSEVDPWEGDSRFDNKVVYILTWWNTDDMTFYIALVYYHRHIWPKVPWSSVGLSDKSVFKCLIETVFSFRFFMAS